MHSKETIAASMTEVSWQEVEQTNFSDEVERHQRGLTYTLPIPTEELRIQSSTGNLGLYYAIGEAYAQIATSFLPSKPTILDIGCSRGRLARFLCLDPTLQYIGFDVHLAAIEWCHEFLSPVIGDRAKFVHADLKSDVFNSAGNAQIANYRFPTDDDTVDMAVASSLFTHLLEPDCVRYLSEIHRVLVVGGTALLSIHIDVPNGEKYCGDPRRIDVDPQYFIQLAKNANLTPIKIIGNVYGQQLVLFAKR